MTTHQPTKPQTCAECQHLARCRWLIQRTGQETECDWTPSRFLPRKPHDTEPSP